MTLTKANIVEVVAEHIGFTNKRSFEIVETLLEIIKGSLESGEDVLISGFGKFGVKEKKERLGRNPATGEAMMLTPRKVVTFRCSKPLRDKINGYATTDSNEGGGMLHL
ncbi:MAG: integration host factor subunit alpha [Deltaproteobacteria bacterium]|jgi:integration host factor subunit alpha|nr:integration host factor subunit alpha [Desulfobacteraceae bacterium]MDH3798561.1 integration host factor subunit alpha [Desulfobacterales bacterium]MDH3929784.1 integration host factor subunit alpha [Deltaproteobacteria bacterium]